MTPLTFADIWPAMSDRLRRTLTARGVPAQDRDDVIQETGLRVYRAWADIDPLRPIWPFVVTVALNVWRDLLRERAGRATRSWAEDVEVRDHHDVERAVLARQELASVGAAMRVLPQEQRRLLLATDELNGVVRPLLPAERVARMRARKQLARAVGRASAVVALIWVRRPLRSGALIATAYVTAMAAAVFTAPVAPAGPGDFVPAPHALQPLVVSSGSFVSVTHVQGHPMVRPALSPLTAVKGLTHQATGSSGPPTAVPPANVCSPAQPSSAGVHSADVHLEAQQIQIQQGRQKPEQVSTPDVHAHGNSGCVDVS